MKANRAQRHQRRERKRARRAARIDRRGRTSRSRRGSLQRGGHRTWQGILGNHTGFGVLAQRPVAPYGTVTEDPDNGPRRPRYGRRHKVRR
jgi:hypothetical protein